MEKVQEMVLAAQKGDMEAFGWLYRETYDRNYYIVIKMVRQEQDTMDILQDAYVKVFQKISLFQYNGSKSFASWTGKIASNTALDFLRKKSPVLFSEMQEDGGDISVPDFEEESVWNQPELALDRKETARIVQELLDCLSEEQRICIILRYIREMKISEIAHECGCSENTIKSRLNYAKKRLLGEQATLEKKGIWLYNVAPFTLLVFSLGNEAAAFQAPPVPASGIEAVMNQAFGGHGIFQPPSGSDMKTAAAKAGKTAAKLSARKMIVIAACLLTVTGAGFGILFHAQTWEGRTAAVKPSVAAGAPAVTQELPITEKPEPVAEPRTEEEVYYEYIRQELAPRYCLAEQSWRGQMAMDYGDMDSINVSENQWLKASGLISAHISDLDQDDRKELFVVYWEKEKNGYDAHDMVGDLYETEGDRVVHKDRIMLSVSEFQWTEIYESVGNFSAIEMTAGEKKYLLFYVYDRIAAFSDGYRAHVMWTVEYKDGRLRKVREVGTTSHGSDDYCFVYKGSRYENGKEKEREVLYDMDDEKAPCKTREEAFIRYFQQDGLDVSEIMEGMEALNPLTFTKTKDASIIFTFNSMIMGSETEENTETIYMAAEISDETRLQDHVKEK